MALTRSVILDAARALSEVRVTAALTVPILVVQMLGLVANAGVIALGDDARVGSGEGVQRGQVGVVVFKPLGDLVLTVGSLQR